MPPFVDLQAQFARLEHDIRQAIDRVLAHGRFVMGPEVQELETQLAAMAGVRHAVACSSGTDALLLILLGLGLQQGQAVFTTPFSFIAGAEAVALLGGVPVFADIDPASLNLDPERLDAAIRRQKTSGGTEPCCILAADIFGQPADYEAINAVARTHGLPVIEDAAQSLGASLDGRPAGSLATAAATSFFPAKPLGCYGDGGAVFTDDDALDLRLRSLRAHGADGHKYEHARIGLNARLDTIQAAILLQKLKLFPEELEMRSQAARRYAEGLQGLPGLEPVWPAAGCTSAWAQFALLTDRRDALCAHLEANGVPYAIHYPRPLHLQPAFAFLGHKQGDMPVAEATCRRIMSLPMHPYLDAAQQDRTCALIRDFFA